MHLALNSEVGQCSKFNIAFRNALAKKATIHEVYTFVKEGTFVVLQFKRNN